MLLDAQTNKPIKGAIVLANWQVKYVPFFIGEVGGPFKSLAVFGEVTDAEGVITQVSEFKLSLKKSLGH